jgi:3-phenylpropionate/cinnamic acid dioxygenase small subunit
MTDLRNRVESFLYLEARLMDEGRYGEWLELFSDDCNYWVPSNSNDTDPQREISILFCNRPMLEAYVRRLAGGKAFAQSPPSRLRRVVGNVEIIEARSTEASLDVELIANFVLVEIRRNTQRLHAGQSRYRLAISDCAIAIRSKQVDLVGIDEPQESITFLL